MKARDVHTSSAAAASNNNDIIIVLLVTDSVLFTHNANAWYGTSLCGCSELEARFQVEVRQ